MKQLLLLAALATFGCQPPANQGVDFSGTYSASSGVLEVGSCTDGSGGSQDVAPVTWTLVDNGDNITIDPHGTCGTFTAKGSGGSAEILGKDCPDSSSPNGVIHSAVHTGDISLGSGYLAVAVEFWESGAVSCTINVNGRLAKQ
jgi:hypothetical protein